MPLATAYRGKRLTDIALVMLAAPSWIPVLLVVALLVFVVLGRPIFFVQLRPGLHGRPFRLIKFRTMTSERDEEGVLFTDDQRLPKFGKFLRSTSLDELPELFNVLAGQMSLVGPRPLLLEYLPLYSRRQARRHEARPGITGWAQVMGRNLTSWPMRLEQDVWYVENASFILDLRILGLTLVSVLRRHGVSAPGRATVARFTGDPQDG